MTASPICLSPWMETVGHLKEIKTMDDRVMASIGPVQVLLPEDIGEKLKGHIGQRIAILKTDLPNKEYLVRTLTDQSASWGSKQLIHPVEGGE